MDIDEQSYTVVGVDEENGVAILEARSASRSSPSSLSPYGYAIALWLCNANRRISISVLPSPPGLSLPPLNFARAPQDDRHGHQYKQTRRRCHRESHVLAPFLHVLSAVMLSIARLQHSTLRLLACPNLTGLVYISLKTNNRPPAADGAGD